MRKNTTAARRRLFDAVKADPGRSSEEYSRSLDLSPNLVRDLLARLEADRSLSSCWSVVGEFDDSERHAGRPASPVRDRIVSVLSRAPDGGMRSHEIIDAIVGESGAPEVLKKRRAGCASMLHQMLKEDIVRHVGTRGRYRYVLAPRHGEEAAAE